MSFQCCWKLLLHPLLLSQLQQGLLLYLSDMQLHLQPMHVNMMAIVNWLKITKYIRRLQTLHDCYRCSHSVESFEHAAVCITC